MSPEVDLEVVKEVAPAASPEAKPELVEDVAPETISKTFPRVSAGMTKNKPVVPSHKPAAREISEEQVAKGQQVAEATSPRKHPHPQFKPNLTQKPAVKNTRVAKKQDREKVEQTIEDILETEERHLFNQVTTQGGGAKRSKKAEAFGGRKNIGDTEKMAQTLVNIVGACIQKKLKLVALGGDLRNRPVVHLRFYLNREGMVVGDPIIEPLSGAQSQEAIMIRQVRAAVFSCQPYTDLPREQYDLWGQGFDFNVDPLQEITR